MQSPLLENAFGQVLKLSDFAVEKKYSSLARFIFLVVVLMKLPTQYIKIGSEFLDKRRRLSLFADFLLRILYNQKKFQKFDGFT